jgi:hypothetical protein
VTIVAEDTAFDTTNLDAAVGETLAITFDNRDDGIPHNLSVEGASGGDAKTDIEQGPTTQTVEVSFDDAGVFTYFCDVHPPADARHGHGGVTAPPTRTLSSHPAAGERKTRAVTAPNCGATPHGHAGRAGRRRTRQGC